MRVCSANASCVKLEVMNLFHCIRALSIVSQMRVCSANASCVKLEVMNLFHCIRALSIVSQMRVCSANASCVKLEVMNLFHCIRALSIVSQMRVFSANAICVKLESGEYIPPYTCIEYRQANERLLNILRRFNEYLPDDYLTACANYVHF
ncbi:hypothetical protein niasHT_036531 [Heterodera trifolii]|uniref:Secreted protein n=1 Tax=Heterodera trifolii TaxID=157864 RepID=A0ABD2IRX6_9BILA